jgi:hypothetical protein
MPYAMNFTTFPPKKYESITFTYVPAIGLNELNTKEIVQLEEQDW